MKKLTSLFILFGLGGVPALAAATTFKDVPVIDVTCLKKAAADPDAHTRSCALTCPGSGYGILTKGGQFLQFDVAGNDEIKKELEASHEKDHLRVNVSGEVEGSTLKVSSVKLL